MRKLASIQKIVSVRPIPDADAIECATVLGWEIVVRKAENFKPGDMVVYIEIDSILPIREEFEFMRDRKFRVRTIKLRKQISQGIIFPLTILPDNIDYKKLEEDDDVTEILSIKKYDPQGDAEDAERARIESIRTNRFNKFFMKYSWYRTIWHWFVPPRTKGWPKFIPHTDETRIQVLPWLPKLLNENKVPCYETEKLDGQSATYFIVKTKLFKWSTNYLFGVCSRRLHLRKKHKCSWWDVAVKFDIQEKLTRAAKDLLIDVAIQGEIIGPGIQDNKYGLKEYDFYVFNVFDVTFEKYFEYEELIKFCAKYNIKMVPVLRTNFIVPSDVQTIMVESTAKSVVNPNILREGIVCRTMSFFLTPHNVKNMTSFKAVSPEFLLGE